MWQYPEKIIEGEMMSKLNSDWFVEGLQDFEYKKYLLLAYLQWVKARFDDAELYPAFSELILHYNNLVKFREGKDQFRNSMPKKLSGIDVEKLRLLYETDFPDDDSLREVEEIVDYSIPRVHRKVEEGKEL